MFSRIKTSPNSPNKSVQLVENFRQDGRVRQRIIRHVGVASDKKELKLLLAMADHIKIKMEYERRPGLFSPEVIEQISAQGVKKEKQEIWVDLEEMKEEQRLIQGIYDVYGKVYDDLDFNRVLKNPARQKSAVKILRHIVLARIANPQSKRASVSMLEKNFGVQINLERVYRMMDKLDDQVVERIQSCAHAETLSLLQQKINVVFFDCTTLYFESFIEDELKQLGFSKDNKHSQSQVLVALLVTTEGLPVGYEVFPGSTYEGHVLIPVLDKISQKYELDKVVFVADSGLFSLDNLEELEKHGYEYIVGARIKNLGKKLTEQVLDRSDYQEVRPISKRKKKRGEDEKEEEFSLASFEYKEGRKLVVSYSSKRARKNAYDRKKAIQKLLDKKKAGKIKAQDLVSNYGYKRYLKVSGVKVEIDEEKMEKDKKWDGLRGVITNAKGFSHRELLKHYHGLWQVEEAFRVTKQDLKVRPIYHWTPGRVRAHLAISFMAYTCVKYLEHRVRLQYKKLSPEVIRKTLLEVQGSILRYKKNQKKYFLPSMLSQHGSKIYKLMNLKRKLTPFEIN